MSRATVRFIIDLKRPPRMTATQRKRLAAVAAMPDNRIDYSDIGRSGKTAKWIRPKA